MEANAGRPPSPDEKLEVALRDLGLAAKSLQLYPAGSHVVQTAVQEAFEALEPLLKDGVLILDVNPTHLRIGEAEIGGERPVIAQLARRLHRHGIARLAFDRHLDADSLERFVATIVRDRHDVDAAGGLYKALRESNVVGVTTELLELERLFAEGDSTYGGDDDIWDSLLRNFSDEIGSGPVDWRTVVGSSRRMHEFFEWLGQHLDETSERTGYEEIDVLRNVLEQAGREAGTLGSEQVNMLALSVRRIADTLKPEVLVDLLAEPMEIEVGDDGDEGAPPEVSIRDFLAGIDVKRDAEGVRKTLDVTRIVAQGLTAEHAESLIFHAVSTTAQSSPRLYRLFDRVLDGRPDRASISRQVRANLEQAFADTTDPGGFLANWPKLTEVLDGEAPDRFVRADYGASLRALLGEESPSAAWASELIRPRLTEMQAGFVIRKKAHVLARVLDTEADDDYYVTCAAELEDALHELIALDDYKEAKLVLGILAEHVESGTRSDAQRSCANGVVERFYRPETLRELVRNSLGKDEEVVDLIFGIIRIRGRAVVPVLLDTLADEDTRRVRERLLKILPALGDAIVARVVERLDDERWYVVRNLAVILGELGSDEVADTLGTLLRHDDERVRRQAAESLIGIGTEAAERHLINASADGDLRVRGIAIKGLGYIATSAGRAHLRRFLRLPNFRGQNTDVISGAAIALGRLKDADSRASLKPLARPPIFFRGRRWPVQHAAAWALEAIAGARPGPAPEPRYLAEIVPSRRRRPGRSGG